MKNVDVCVIGGGFSGLYISSMIDADIHIFEEHSNIGFPMHCAGVISPRTFHMLKIPDRFIEAKYDCMIIRFNDYKLYWFGNPLALKVDRVGIERYFYDKCLSLGHKIYLNSFVFDLNPRGIVNVHGGLTFKSRLIILAEGYKRIFSRRLGLIDFDDTLIGLQAFVDGNVKCNHINIYVDKKFSDYFSWFIPIGDNKCIIGLTVKNSKDGINFLKLFLKRLVDDGLISNVNIRNFFGGLIVRGPIGHFGTGRVFGLGDSIQMNKPLTGGGLYPICVSSIVLSKFISNYLNGSLNFKGLQLLYSKFFSEFSKTFKLSFRIVDLISKMDYYAIKALIRGGFKLGLHENLFFNIDYDEHFHSVLRNPSSIIKFSLALLMGLIP